MKAIYLLVALLFCSMGCTGPSKTAMASSSGDGDSPDVSGKPKHRPVAKHVVSNNAVTQSEAKQVFGRLDKVVAEVLKMPVPASALPDSTDPVTRAQIIAEFQRVFELSKPKFTFDPQKQTFDESLISFSDPVAKASAENLVTWGLVARVHPLVTAKEDSITVASLGDAIGIFLTRLSELTHVRSKKYSPEFMDRARP
jgi:hypothetical protein